jgi:hypothetical protein
VSPAKDGPRDWDRELADIDRLIAAGGGSAPVPAAPAKGKGGVPAAGGGGGPAGPAADRRALLGTWFWFLLATLLGVGLTQWPWPYACGMRLYGYLGAVGLFGVASLASLVLSWRTRSAVVHWLSLGLLGWAAFLGAREVLPRIGYARRVATWECPVAAVAPSRAPARPR